MTGHWEDRRVDPGMVWTEGQKEGGRWGDLRVVWMEGQKVGHRGGL